MQKKNKNENSRDCFNKGFDYGHSSHQPSQSLLSIQKQQQFLKLQNVKHHIQRIPNFLYLQNENMRSQNT
jgi:hypothetical protein